MSPVPDPSVRTVRRSFRLFEAFFLLSLFLFPMLLGSAQMWAFSIGALVLTAAFGLHWVGQGSRDGALHTGLDRWIALYVVCFLVSLFFSKIPYFSWIELYKLTVVLCAFVAVRYLCRDRLRIYHLAEGLVFIGALLAAIGLLQFVGGLPKDWWSHSGFVSSTYVNHNHFAGLLVLLLPITLGMILAERDKSKKVLFIFLGTLMGVAFVFTLSRGAIIALSLSMAAMMGVLRRRRMISSVVMPFAVMLALIVCAVVIFGTGTIEQRIGNIQAMIVEEELSLKFRWMTWAGTLPMIKHFFWFGSGPGTFGHLFLAFRPEGGFAMRPVHTHNDLLQLFAECGVFTFAAAAVLLFFFFRYGLRIIGRDSSRLRNGVGTGILAGIFGMLIHALFDFNFHIPANWLLASVAAGLLLAMDEDRYYEGRIAKVFQGSVTAVLLCVPLAALYLGPSDYRIWEAKQLWRSQERRLALGLAENAVKWNPFDAEAYYLLGSLLPVQRAEEARLALERAIQLNPYEPAYDIAKARVMAPTLIERSPEQLVEFLERAIEKDPNNPALGAMAADLVFLQKRAERQPAFREAVFAMLAKRRETLAGLVSYLEKKDLWSYHRPHHLKLHGANPDAAKQGAPDDLWSRRPSQELTLSDFSYPDRVPPLKDDLFYRPAEISRKIDGRGRMARIAMNAKGFPAAGIYPAVYVKIDGKLVDEYYVNTKSYKNYYTDVRLEPGEHRLSFQYANDWSGGPHEDRNLSVKRIFIIEY